MDPSGRFGAPSTTQVVGAGGWWRVGGGWGGGFSVRVGGGWGACGRCGWVAGGGGRWEDV